MKHRVQIPLPALLFEDISDYYKADEGKNFLTKWELKHKLQ
jgi:hypothetical protein